MTSVSLFQLSSSFLLVLDSFWMEERKKATEKTGRRILEFLEVSCHKSWVSWVTFWNGHLVSSCLELKKIFCGIPWDPEEMGSRLPRIVGMDQENKFSY